MPLACVPILQRWEDDGRHWLLIRRSISDPQEKRYHFVFAPPGTSLQEMVKASGARWHIEEDAGKRQRPGSGPLRSAEFRRLVSTQHARTVGSGLSCRDLRHGAVLPCSCDGLSACQHRCSAGPDRCLSCAICSHGLSGPPLRPHLGCWPGRGGAALTKAVPAITIQNGA
jgi:hypothetical protein